MIYYANINYFFQNYIALITVQKFFPWFVFSQKTCGSESIKQYYGKMILIQCFSKAVPGQHPQQAPGHLLEM